MRQKEGLIEFCTTELRKGLTDSDILAFILRIVWFLLGIGLTMKRRKWSEVPITTRLVLKMNRNIEVLLLFVSHRRSRRVAGMNKYIQAHRNLSKISFEYWFVDGPELNDLTYPNLHVPEPFWHMLNYAWKCKRCDPKQAHLLVKYAFCVNYTLNQTNIRWLLRLADDTFVNFAKLGDFIAEKNSKYDPLKEFVFKAHCISWTKWIYAQGGSGFLLSRYGCEIATKHIIPIMSQKIEVEDIVLGTYMRSMGFVPAEMSDGHFLGHTPFNLQKFLRTVSYGRDSCAGYKTHAMECGKGISTLNSVVFFHGHTLRMDEAMRVAEWIFNAKPNIFWWTGVYDRTSLCFSSTKFGRWRL
jgi:hypothetical protein